MKDDIEGADTLIEKMMETKGQLAEVVIAIYSQSHSFQEFEQRLRETLAQSGGVPIEEVDDYVLGSYIYPPSLKQDYMRSPVESIWATLENLKVAAEMAQVGEKSAHGMLLSGGMAHSPFLGVRGKTPEALAELGAQQLEYSEFSDIDFLVTCENFAKMRSFVNDFVEAGILDRDELKRFAVFEHYHKQGKVDTISIRAHHKDVQQSLHLLLDETVESIANCREQFHRKGIGYVRDFRPNMPRSLVKKGHYLAYNLVAGTEVKFPIHLALLSR
jgi:hypothetical protein